MSGTKFKSPSKIFLWQSCTCQCSCGWEQLKDDKWREQSKCLTVKSISGAMGLQRRNNFIPDQITKPVQEKDLDVLEDFSSPEHLLQVCFTRSTTAVGLRTAILTFTLYPRPIPAHKEKLTAGGATGIWRVSVSRHLKPWMWAGHCKENQISQSVRQRER